MKTLIVGVGALGGMIGARLLAAGGFVSLATRNAKAAEEIKASGLRVTGVGGNLSTEAGDAKASMLQDFERRRTTEIAFINGYVVDTGRQFGVSTPANAAIVETVHAITCGQSSPDPNHLQQILQSSVDRGDASVSFALNSNGERR